MSNFGTTIKLGLGDVIYTWAALEKVKHKYDNIYIDANWSILEIYKHNSQEYRKFFTELVKTLFNDDKYILFGGVNCPMHEFSDLANLGIKPTLPRAAHLLCKTSPHVINDPYILLTTKVRQLNKDIYDEFKDKFVSSLNNLSNKYKIVLIGEREIESNPEYDVYGNRHIYSIYDDLIKINNVIDLTVPIIGCANPSLDKMMEDCYLMNKASAVITIGCGGNLALATATSNNLIGIRADDYTFINDIFRVTANICVTFDKDLFFNRINQL